MNKKEDNKFALIGEIAELSAHDTYNKVGKLLNDDTNARITTTQAVVEDFKLTDDDVALLKVLRNEKFISLVRELI